MKSFFRSGSTRTFWRITFIAFLLAFSFGCSSQRPAGSGDPNQTRRKMILRDEGLSQLSFVNLADSQQNWHVAIPAGRDLQLVGSGRVLIGTGNGYEEREILTGKKLRELTSYDGTIAARRRRNGNTFLVGMNWKGKEGIVLVELDKRDSFQRLISFPGFSYVRLVRETPQNTFLVTADDMIFEGTADGKIVWQAKIVGREKPHVWQAVRLANGNTVASTGFAANLQVFARDGKLLDSIRAISNTRPHFFAGFQILSNGNFVVTNWQGHGPKFGGSGVQLLEFTPRGDLSWSWKQDSTKFSSLQGVIILDGLNIDKLHVESESGSLVPAN